jgi:hypothetical protein
VLATLGRVEDLEADGRLDALLRSGARFSETAMLVSSLQAGTLQASASLRIGLPMIFGRLWEQTGCRAVTERGTAWRLGASGRNRRLRERIISGLESLSEAGAERAVVNGTANLEQKIGTPS